MRGDALMIGSIAGHRVIPTESASVGASVVNPFPQSTQKLQLLCSTYDGSKLAYCANTMDQYSSDNASLNDICWNKNSGFGNTYARHIKNRSHQSFDGIFKTSFTPRPSNEPTCARAFALGPPLDAPSTHPIAKLFNIPTTELLHPFAMAPQRDLPHANQRVHRVERHERDVRRVHVAN